MRKRERSRLNEFPESNSFRITTKKSIIANILHKLLFVPQPIGIDTIGPDRFQLAAKYQKEKKGSRRGFGGRAEPPPRHDVSTCRV